MTTATPRNAGHLNPAKNVSRMGVVHIILITLPMNKPARLGNVCNRLSDQSVCAKNSLRCRMDVWKAWKEERPVWTKETHTFCQDLVHRSSVHSNVFFRWGLPPKVSRP